MTETSKIEQDVQDQVEETKLLSMFKEKYDLAMTYYTPEHRRMKLLDATDRGELWKALNCKFPPYQILPDTNHVNYTKANLLASLYTVAKSAEVQPTSDEDKQLTVDINIALDKVWDLSDIGYFEFMAGERAALLNLGITQVGWDEQLTGGNSNSFYKGNVSVKNVDPLKFIRDPFAPDLESGSFCATYESYHKSVFLENPNYKDKFKAYESTQKGTVVQNLPEYAHEKNKGAAKDYYTLIIFWIKDGDKINEYHTVNLEKILYYKEDIQPSMYPFAELYCNLPATSTVGISEPAKIFANSVAYNMLDSIALTAEYKNQRPPKFISTQAGMNVAAFAKHGDEADKTFVVNGDASKAVHYHQFPAVSPIFSILKTGLSYDIQDISGIDGKYTGRDTGSITTTGGTQEMLNRVTLIDTPKIKNYERYTRRLSQLILSNLLHFCPKRKYFIQVPNETKWKTVEVDFPKLDNNTLFNYSINISSELPKNKARIENMANMLMEKQMQYQQQGQTVQLITEEEWLMMQDLPNKEFMLERMGLQRNTDALQEASGVLYQYGELIKKGVPPEDALMAAAGMLQKKRSGVPMDETISENLQAADANQMNPAANAGINPQMPTGPTGMTEPQTNIPGL